jgi:hypothetical protein
MASRAASGVKATFTFGWGIPALANALVVASLSPQTCATEAILTVGIPQEFNTDVAYKPRVNDNERSNMASS